MDLNSHIEDSNTYLVHILASMSSTSDLVVEGALKAGAIVDSVDIFGKSVLEYCLGACYLFSLDSNHYYEKFPKWDLLEVLITRYKFSPDLLRAAKIVASSNIGAVSDDNGFFFVGLTLALSLVEETEQVVLEVDPRDGTKFLSNKADLNKVKHWVELMGLTSLQILLGREMVLSIEEGLEIQTLLINNYYRSLLKLPNGSLTQARSRAQLS